MHQEGASRVGGWVRGADEPKPLSLSGTVME